VQQSAPVEQLAPTAAPHPPLELPEDEPVPPSRTHAVEAAMMQASMSAVLQEAQATC